MKLIVYIESIAFVYYCAMNLKDLKYIVAVAEARHFGKAAERCFVSQPTLSAQIKKVEEHLGVVLFERGNRSVTLTPEGEAILGQARRVLEEADSLEQLARAHRDPLAGPLRLGAIPTLSPYLMPLILPPLRSDLPNLQPVLSEEMTASLLARLADHSLDCALLATAAGGEFTEWPLFDEPFWLAHPRNHPLYTKEEITLEDLRSLDLLLLSDGHCLADQVLELCGMRERPRTGPMGDLRAASLETLIQLVAAGYGCTLVPALALSGSWITGSGVIVHKIMAPQSWRRVRLVFRPSFPRQAALGALTRIIRDHLPNTVRPVFGPEEGVP